ncbi:MAG: hypothetical protein AB8B49_03620 [Nitratireductor sp.]
MRMNILAPAKRGSTAALSTHKKAANLHRKSVELAGLARKSPISKSRMMISALLCHGARARRCSKDAVLVKLCVYSPNGKKAVSLGYR